MTITEVRIKLCEQNSERLLAFCSVTLSFCNSGGSSSFLSFSSWTVPFLMLVKRS